MVDDKPVIPIRKKAEGQEKEGKEEGEEGEERRKEK